MTDNYVEFAQAIDHLVPILSDEALKLFRRKIAFDLLRGLILKSPVGNPQIWKNPNAAPPGYVGGTFRRNWITTLNAPTEVWYPQADKSGGTAIAEGGAVIFAAGPYQDIWFTNNMPYARRLNEGHSTQAPVGWVEAEIARVNLVFARST